LLAAEADLISVVEVEPETLWTSTADPAEPYRPDRSALDRLRACPSRSSSMGGFSHRGLPASDPSIFRSSSR